ncbi:hypothetical protein LTR36_006482 [Oleoguttula mirabilis]|uniref:L-asparaginase n=1 Tax=Oleoguttula mirabilis TaxID=1507867 RepID=A0AAV9JWN1_9PEZI|nr:hypothetical protein LTR36_006482 [Oleoguttula mirabilis]
MTSSEKPAPVRPRIIIHGGAGNITRQNLPRQSYQAYHDALLGILGKASSALSQPGATALDVATHAVTLLENNPLFNSGHGAVYTTAGTHELEASVMVSRGYRKRGVGVMKVTRAKNPILLAKAMLVRGEMDNGGGAQGHCQLYGETCDRLAGEWGLDIVKPSYFWTRKRWDEHRRGLGLDHDDETYRRDRREANALLGDGSIGSCAGASGDSSDSDGISVGDVGWDGKEYLPQGTVGAVVLDSTGTTCVATSTGGLTNKLPGRIGDTPTIGAGFWAEEWQTTHLGHADIDGQREELAPFTLAALIGECLPALSGYMSIPSPPTHNTQTKVIHSTRAVAMSGTGNGDSFLRINAVRTAAAIARYSRSTPLSSGVYPLQTAVSTVAGPHGMLQQSAEDRWLKTGEGEGGIIGIDFDESVGGKVVADFNCGGMFRAWVDDEGKQRMAIFREEV